MENKVDESRAEADKGVTASMVSLHVKKEQILGVRHLQVLFMFFCSLLGFQMRVNVSVGVVAMTNANSSNPDFPEYNWSEFERNYILSSFFWGNVFTQFLGGYVSSQYGAKYILFLSTLGVSIFTLITPFVIGNGSWQLFCGLRVFVGLFQGVMYPSFYAHLARWSPSKERNILGGFITSGMELGTVLGFVLGGYISASSLGWPATFYIPGSIGIIWAILWLFFGANSPSECKMISLAERKMIEKSSSENKKKNKKVPWKSIFTSGPYLTLLFVKITQAWSYQTLMLQLPTYIHGVLKQDVATNALFSAIPYMITCLLSISTVIFVDFLMRKNYITLTVLRKGLNSFASCVPAAAYIGLCFISADDVIGNIVLLSVAVAAASGQTIGSSLNHIDLSPNHAGLIYGITNTTISLIGLLSPIVIGYIVTDSENRSQWEIIFIMLAVLLLVGNFCYMIFGRMTVQPWNDNEEESQSKDIDQNKPKAEVLI
ncbi:hypothetical protein ACFFRR_008003 [Megaselia abdita]